MNKKVIVTSIIFIIVCLFSSICFANTENVMDAAKNTTVNLRDEITNSIDKTENSTRNVTQDVMTKGGQMMNSAGNMINNMTGNNNDNNTNNNKNGTTNNNAGYNTTRTAVDDAYFGTAGMDTTTWLWIILAIAAIIIIAAVWYYAMQGTHIDEDK